MSPENKQRVVGVIVLAAFIALLIPFLFTSGVKKRHALEEVGDANVALQTAATNPPVENAQEPAKDTLSESLQQQSMPAVQSTIPPDQSDKSNGLPESNQAMPQSPEPIKQEVLPESETPSSLPVNTADVNSQAVAPSMETVVETASVEPAKPKVIIKKAKNKSAKVKEAVTSKVKNAQKGAKVLWSVQVGSFSDHGRMQKMVENLRAKGFRVFLQKISTSSGQMVRVLVGRESCKEKAMKIAEKLKTTLAIDGRLVSNKK